MEEPTGGQPTLVWDLPRCHDRQDWFGRDAPGPSPRLPQWLSGVNDRRDRRSTVPGNWTPYDDERRRSDAIGRYEW